MPIFSKATERGQRLVQWLERTPPILIFGGLAFLGISLTLVSTAVHLDSVFFTTVQKKLGYLNEINWSANFSFVVPVAAFFAFASLNSAPQVIRNLSASGMLVRSSGEPLDGKGLVERYQKMAGTAIFIACSSACCRLR